MILTAAGLALTRTAAGLAVTAPSPGDTRQLWNVMENGSLVIDGETWHMEERGELSSTVVIT